MRPDSIPAASRIEDIPTSQLKLLVAFAASWRIAGRAPTTAELKNVIKTPAAVAAVTALMNRGLLTQDWRHGVRLRSTLRPTRLAWAQLPPVVEEWAA